MREDPRVDQAENVLAGTQPGGIDHGLHPSTRGNDTGGRLMFEDELDFALVRGRHFAVTGNRVWLLERHDYRTPAEARDRLLTLAAAVVR